MPLFPRKKCENTAGIEGEKHLERKGNLYTGRYIWDFQGAGTSGELTTSSSAVCQRISIGSLPKTSPKWGALVRVITRRALWGQCCPLSPLAFWWHRQLRTALFLGTRSVLHEKCSNCISGVILLGQMKHKFANNMMRRQIWCWLSAVEVVKGFVFYCMEYMHFMYVKGRCKIQ